MWKIVQCAIQGRGHIKTEIPCQDKTYSLVKNEINVIALADGAGSAKFSHFGAETITQFICDDFSKNFDSYFSEENGISIKKELTSKIIIELVSLSNELNCEVKELASTLMVVAVKNNEFIISHIGDGVIGYLKNDDLKIASHPENGEFVNTTVFTTSKDVLLSMKLIKGNLNDITGFVLMSDGAESSLYNKREKKLANVLKKIMDLCIIVSQAEIEKQLANSFETIIKNATMDDCSIIFMVKDKNFFPGYTNLSKYEKEKLLNCSHLSKKQLKRYDSILKNLEQEKTLKEISKIIHLKSKYTKRYLDKLLKLNLIKKKGRKYQTIIIMSIFK